MSEWTEQDIIRLLETKPFAVERAIVHLYNCQTPSEKAAGSTVEDNGKGFNSADARMGTYMAKWYLKTGKRFSGKYKKRALRMAKKYRKQLVARANQKAPKVSSRPVQVEAPKPVSQSAKIAAETQARFNAEALKAKVNPLPKRREPKQIDLRFSNLELD